MPILHFRGIKIFTCLMLFLAVLFLLLADSRSWSQESDSRTQTSDDVEVQSSFGGLASADREKIAKLVAEAIKEGQTPGAVVCIGNSRGIDLLVAYGHRQTDPVAEEMTVDSIFDLASLTKPIATATSIMILVERGRIDLDKPVATWLTEFGNNGKEEITVRQLLLHNSGLTPDNSLKDYGDGPEEAIRRINELKLNSKPGEKFAYSDVGFIVLAELVRKVSGKDVNRFSRENIFEPLGMKQTGFLPTESLQAQAAATEKRDGAWIKGEVHDPRAYALDGVAGHAGLFSTAEDLARFAQMLLKDGSSDLSQILKPETVALMRTRQKVSSGVRGLGWDMKTGYSSNRGKTMSESAFGHGGFTGTSIWIDPKLDLFVIFLSTRLHPDGKGSVNQLAGAIGTVAADARLESSGK